MEIQKFEYLEKEKSFLDEIKNIFHSFWRAIVWWKIKIWQKLVDTSFKFCHWNCRWGWYWISFQYHHAWRNSWKLHWCSFQKRHTCRIFLCIITKKNVSTYPFYIFIFWCSECSTLIIRELLLNLLHFIFTNIAIFIKPWLNSQIL